VCCGRDKGNVIIGWREVGRTNEFEPFDVGKWTVEILFSCQVCSFISSEDGDGDGDMGGRE
jgi:hypothetical protein